MKGLTWYYFASKLFFWIFCCIIFLFYTVMRNCGMNQNFADVNPERDFQPFNDEKNSHLRTKISWSKTTWNQKKIKVDLDSNLHLSRETRNDALTISDTRSSYKMIKFNKDTYIMCHQFSVISRKMKYLFSFLSKHKSITKK